MILVQDKSVIWSKSKLNYIKSIFERSNYAPLLISNHKCFPLLFGICFVRQRCKVARIVAKMHHLKPLNY